MRNLGLLVFETAVIFLPACATSGVRSNVDANRPSRRSDIITRQEIQQRAPSALSAEDAVRSLRATWLRPTGVPSLRSGTPVRLYIDNVASGTIDMLSTVPIERIVELRYYNARDATSRWGTGHAVGAIEVITGPTGPRTAGPEPVTVVEDSGRVTPAPSVTFRPFVPFEVDAVFFVNGGTSVFDAPKEKEEVWHPQYNMGAGIGVTATRNVTVFAAFEYHSFAFSESSTLAYLMEAEFQRLRSADGVEISGSNNTIVNISANLKIHPRVGFIRPYLVGGVGYARLNSGTFTVSGTDGAPLPQSQFGPGTASGGGQVENAFSMAAGVGFDLELPSDFRLFVDGRYIEAIRGPRYNDVWDRNQLFNTRFLPVRIGVTYR